MSANATRMALTAELRQAIRDARAEHPGWSYKKLGRKFGVSTTSVFNAVHEKRDRNYQSPYHGPLTYHWEPRICEPPPLPVMAVGFIRPPTRAQLMAGR